MVHVICIQMRLGHLNGGVGDSSRHNEDIVKNLELPFSLQLLLLLDMCVHIFICVEMYV